MTKEEIIKFIQKIKREYPNFPTLTEDEYHVWIDTLSKISKELADLKYEDYKKETKVKNKYPTIELFLKSSENKQQTKYLMTCPYCGRLLYDKAMNLHEARHRSINYIKSRAKKYFNVEMTPEKYSEFLTMQQNAFDIKYYEFILKLIPKMSESLELKNLLIIKFLYEHPGKKITNDIQGEIGSLKIGGKNENIL